MHGKGKRREQVSGLSGREILERSIAEGAARASCLTKPTLIRHLSQLLEDRIGADLHHPGPLPSMFCSTAKQAIPREQDPVLASGFGQEEGIGARSGILHVVTQKTKITRQPAEHAVGQESRRENGVGHLRRAPDDWTAGSTP